MQKVIKAKAEVAQGFVAQPVRNNHEGKRQRDRNGHDKPAAAGNRSSNPFSNEYGRNDRRDFPRRQRAIAGISRQPGVAVWLVFRDRAQRGAPPFSVTRNRSGFPINCNVRRAPAPPA